MDTSSEEVRANQIPTVNVLIQVKVRDVDGSVSDELIKGRADWVLGYGRNKANTGSILVVVEAKPIRNPSIGLEDHWRQCLRANILPPSRSRRIPSPPFPPEVKGVRTSGESRTRSRVVVS